MMAAPEPAPGLFAWYAPGFSDALGDRLLLFDNTDGRPLELLRLSPAIAKAPDAEFLLRARTHELASLDDDRFARVRRVDLLPQPGGGLAIVSEQVEGQRLSEFLAAVSQRGGHVGPDLVIAVVATLLGAVAAMHRTGAHVAHGALVPERLVVAPGGRVVITEHVLGLALQQVALDPDGLWRQLRVALPPPPAVAALDQNADILQIALVALAMLLGRPLHADEDPSRAATLLFEAADRAAEAGWDPADWLAFERWLSRAFSIGTERGFRHAAEAVKAFESLDKADEVIEEKRSVDTTPALPPPAPDTRVQRRALPAGSRAADVRRRTLRRRKITGAALAACLATAAVYLAGIPFIGSPHPARPSPAVQPRAKPAAPVAAPATTAASSGATLDVRSDPPGARVFLDGQPRGVTPVRAADLTRGQHQVRLEIDGRSITEAVTLEAGRVATLFVPLRPAGAPAAGWLTVIAPVELQVFEDGRLLGSSRMDRIMLPSGRHKLSLVNEPIGFRAARDVFVPLGQTATANVTLPDGRADINAAPWAEVWIDGQKAGDTPLANLRISPGRHTVTFKHPRFGERTVECWVTLQEPLRLSADLRK